MKQWHIIILHCWMMFWNKQTTINTKQVFHKSAKCVSCSIHSQMCVNLMNVSAQPLRDGRHVSSQGVRLGGRDLGVFSRSSSLVTRFAGSSRTRC